jgi:hypothetical protein
MTAWPLSDNDQPPLDTDPTVPSALDQSDVLSVLTLFIVQAAVVLAGFDLTVVAGISATTLIVSVMIPVWWREVAGFSLAVPILLLGGAAMVWGLYLAELSSTDHIVSRSLQVSSIVHLIDGLAIMVAVLWGRTHFPLHRIAALYGVGALADVLLNTSRSWKFDLAVPVAVLVIGWMGKYRGSLSTVAVLVGLGTLGILDGGRSYAAFCVATAGLVFWQMRPTGADRPTNRWYPAVLLAALAAGIYGAASSLLTKGYFGSELQQRSVDQIDATGSLIAGGRPEWAATRALVEYRPGGYGIGVVPDLVDHGIAKSGMASINVDTGGYLTNYMMGGQFRLHSITSDLWVRFGIVGVVLAAIIVYAVIRSTSTLLAQRQAPAIVVFMGVLALWHMAFGPIYSNWPDVCLALGVVLLVRTDVPPNSTESVPQRRASHGST